MDGASDRFDHRVPVALDQLRVTDAVGEGDHPLGCMVMVDGPGDAVVGGGGGRIGQAVPAPGETHSVVNLELVLVVDGDVVVSVEHRVLGHSDDQHLVIGEMSALHCFAERHAVHLGAVHRRVVHRVHVEAARGILHPAASRLGVHPRSRSHVQPLGDVDPAGIVNQRVRRDGAMGIRGRLAGSGLLDARGAMRFIADRQVECRRGAEQARIRLGIGNQAQRLVGAEHHGHRAGVCRRQLRCDAFGICRYRHRQLDEPSVLSRVASACVRAHADVAMRDGGVALACPLAHGLVHQCDRRNQIQHTAADASKTLGDPQRHH